MNATQIQPSLERLFANVETFSGVGASGTVVPLMAFSSAMEVGCESDNRLMMMCPKTLSHSLYIPTRGVSSAYSLHSQETIYEMCGTCNARAIYNRAGISPTRITNRQLDDSCQPARSGRHLLHNSVLQRMRVYTYMYMYLRTYAHT